MSFSRGSSPPRGRTRVSAPPALAGRFFTPEPPGEPECSLPSLCFSHSKTAPDTCLLVSVFPVYVDYQGFPGGTRGEEPPASAGDVRDLGSIPGWGRSPGGGHGHPLQYSCLENPVHRGAWQATGCAVSKSRTQLQ